MVRNYYVMSMVMRSVTSKLEMQIKALQHLLEETSDPAEQEKIKELIRQKQEAMTTGLKP